LNVGIEKHLCAQEFVPLRKKMGKLAINTINKMPCDNMVAKELIECEMMQQND
jgi:hypothetical protein